MSRLERYAQLVGDDYIQSLYDLGGQCRDKSMVHVNSTYYGGGVAEMLNSYVPLLNDAGLSTEWRLLKASREFFAVTKKMHNALQGKSSRLSDKDVELYEQAIDSNAEFTRLDWYDLVVIDDAQPCGLVTRYSRKSPSLWKPLPIFLKLLEFQKKQAWVWRCHIDLTKPDESTWAYLRKYVEKYDAVVVSSPKYRTSVRKPHYYILPAIDPLSDKNREMTDSEISRKLQKYGIEDDRPLVLQVSRFDPWKDPLGVIDAYRRVRKKAKCQLVLIGSMATDDPEGEEVFNQVFREVEKEDDVHLITSQDDLLVNALQRRADVVVQKSLREGFGLTVSEAMWKGTPVVASRVGGIPLQIDDGENGYLVDNIPQCADRIAYLLTHASKARQLGMNAVEKVRKSFLMPRLVKDELELFLGLTRPASKTRLQQLQRRLAGTLKHFRGLLPPFS